MDKQGVLTVRFHDQAASNTIVIDKNQALASKILGNQSAVSIAHVVIHILPAPAGYFKAPKSKAYSPSAMTLRTAVVC